MTPNYKLLSNVHENLPPPPSKVFSSAVTVQGKYEYWHYCCDEVDDRGFGCGYRTLQTICSWLNNFKSGGFIPSLPEIQKILVDMEDKPIKFLGSKDWIGSFEVFLVIDKVFDVPSKIMHVSRNNLQSHFLDIKAHFEKFGSPIMMGGDVDASSKGVFGAATSTDNQDYLLILDPHYCGKPLEKADKLFQDNWVSWKSVQYDFSDSSFYNLCLPQISLPTERIFC